MDVRRGRSGWIGQVRIIVREEIQGLGIQRSPSEIMRPRNSEYMSMFLVYCDFVMLEISITSSPNERVVSY